MQKFLILGLFTFFSLSASAALRDTEVECTLSLAQSARVATVSLHSELDEIRLELRDGTKETLKPIENLRQGTFGLDDFSKHVAWNNGQVFTTSPSVGDIFIRHHCFLSPTLFFERCLVQGTAQPAPYAGVRMNLEGKVLNFFDRNICNRKDHGPF